MRDSCLPLSFYQKIGATERGWVQNRPFQFEWIALIWIGRHCAKNILTLSHTDIISQKKKNLSTITLFLKPVLPFDSYYILWKNTLSNEIWSNFTTDSGFPLQTQMKSFWLYSGNLLLTLIYEEGTLLTTRELPGVARVRKTDE